MDFKKSVTYKWLKSSYKKVAKEEGISVAKLKQRMTEEAWDVFRTFNFTNPALLHPVWGIFQSYDKRKSNSWDKLLNKNDTYKELHFIYSMGDDAWAQMKHKLFNYNDEGLVTHYKNKPLISLSAEELDEVRYILSPYARSSYILAVYRAITGTEDFLKKITGTKEEQLSIFEKFLEMNTSHKSLLPAKVPPFCCFNFEIMDFFVYIVDKFKQEFTLEVTEEKEIANPCFSKSSLYEVKGKLSYKDKLFHNFEKPFIIEKHEGEKSEKLKVALFTYYADLVHEYLIEKQEDSSEVTYDDSFEDWTQNR